jgi:5-methylcytosine-specific restriction endonuclease McrA
MIAQLLARFQGRSTRWPALRRETVNAQPFCSACSAKKSLDVHHVMPFHLDKALELSPANLIVLCRRCHLLFGHFDDWKSFNAKVRQDAAVWAERIKGRRG